MQGRNLYRYLWSSVAFATTLSVAPATLAQDDDADDESASTDASESDASESGETAPGAEAPPPPAVPARPPASLIDDSSTAARLEALEDLVRRYEEESADFREELRVVAERKYKERRRQIEDHYARQLAPVIEAERRHRLDAIATFERFLERHPNDPAYTPDALFRLAELYFEKTDDEFQQDMKVFREEYEAWARAGSEGEPPEEPRPKFTRTIELYRDLIARFPDYRLIDGAYYLLGYTLKAHGEDEESMTVWRALVAKYPQSRFFAEVWFRLGDYHFDEEEWPEAISAFMNVVPLKESAYYDKALYKLAWTYYLVNEFDKSVRRFFELLDFSYAKKTGKPDDKAGSVLEEEAIQYVAISFSDDNWDRPNSYKTLIAGDSFDDEFAEFDTDYVRFAVDYFNKIEAEVGAKKPYRRDIFAKLGDILFKQSKNKQAVLALEQAIELDPLHRDAPKLQDLIVQAWEREREFDKASAARDVLVAKYGRDSEWGKQHKGDSEALRQAADLARISLYKAAIYYHQQAQKFFEDDRQDLGVQFFQAASQAYKEYLELYPHDKEAYELTYYLADTYYYSLAFREAADTYTKVRDSTLGKKYQAEAAVNIVYALDKVIERAIESGELDDKDIFSPKEPAEGEERAGPQEIPALRKEYIAAIDRVAEIAPKHEQAPAFKYRAAAILYAYGFYDDAVKRFEALVAEYPSHEAARFAANYILDYLLAQKDWEKAAQYAQRFQETIKDDSGTFAKIEGGARFQIATKLLQEGEQALAEDRLSEGLAKLEQGADAYLQLIAEDPKREFADAMMYNAALSLEKARRPARAAGLYERLYKEYPDSQYAPEAMFRVATKSEQAFDFNKAVSTYLALVKTYPESERRADAQINAALALEGQQKYEEAAREFEKFATLFPERPEAAAVFFRAALVHKKRKRPSDELATLNKFISRYRNKPEQVARVVEAHTRIGDIWNERAEDAKQWKEIKSYRDKATEAWKDAVDQQRRSGASGAAAYFAAKASFSLAELELKSFQKMTIAGNTGKKQANELVEKTKRLTEVEKVYKDVITTYKQAEWSLASLYRIGYLYDNLQRSIFEAPCPPDIRRIDEIACDEYRSALEDKAYAVEEKAVEAYRVAYERSIELKITNTWTRKTLEALNLLRAQEYPIDKDPIVDAREGDIYQLGLVLPNGGASALRAVEQQLGVTSASSEGTSGADGQASSAGGEK